MRRTSAALVALAVLAAGACTRGNGATPEPLPMIATDQCPEPAHLLSDAEIPATGRRLPDVTLPCLGHEGTVRMRALGRIPTVVNLWGSWCEPCKNEMPEFQKVHLALGGRVRILGVDTNDFERPARGTIQRTGISYPSVVDKEQRVKRALNSRVLPATAFVGADGVIRHVNVGEMTATELRAAITKYLGVS